MADQQVESVGQGTWVKLAGFGGGEEEVFRIVPEGPVDYLNNEVPPDNPLARALQGAKVGDKVSFHPPEGEVELTILDVGRL